MATVNVKQVFGVFHEWDQGDSRLHTNDPKCGPFSTIVLRVRIIFLNPLPMYSKHTQVNISISQVSKICKTVAIIFYDIDLNYKGVYLRVSLKFVKYFPRLNLGHACTLLVLL